jgi:hypothetical protein
MLINIRDVAINVVEFVYINFFSVMHMITKIVGFLYVLVT